MTSQQTVGVKPGAKIFGIVLLLTAILTGLYFFSDVFKKKGGNIANTEAVSNTTVGTAAGFEGASETSGNSVNASGQSFDYTPAEPDAASAILRGVVEVGASGFNSFVIKMDRQKNWKIVSKDFGASLTYEGMASDDDINNGLKNYISQMLAKGVNKNNLHFVISSGAMKNPATTKIASELSKRGWVVNKVTAEQEGKYAAIASIPTPYIENSFSLDIGSGNSKLQYYTGTSQILSNIKSFEGPGAKYFQNGTSDASVYSTIKNQAVSIPTGKRNVCFIIGGIPYELAKKTRNGNERYTVLNAPDSYEVGEADAKLKSGLNIYKAVKDGTSTDTFVFDWDANFTIGFLLSLPMK